MNLQKAQYQRFALVMLCLFATHLFSAVQSETYTKAELLGQISPATNPGFTEIPPEYCSRPGIYLRNEVLEAFLKLRQAAEDEDIDLKVLSGTRSFNHQKSIWDRKWARTRYMGWQDLDKAQDILTYSSMPGTSRHHWGTDIDLNSLENEYFNSGEGAIVYDFLERCGNEFGFSQVYTSKENGRTGYEEEKWHWSYMPVSSVILEEYNKFIRNEDIGGFDGSNSVDSIKIIPDYVNGIAK